jgi:hypothetical protein
MLGLPFRNGVTAATQLPQFKLVRKYLVVMMKSQ